MSRKKHNEEEKNTVQWGGMIEANILKQTSINEHILIQSNVHLGQGELMCCGSKWIAGTRKARAWKKTVETMLTELNSFQESTISSLDELGDEKNPNGRVLRPHEEASYYSIVFTRWCQCVPTSRISFLGPASLHAKEHLSWFTRFAGFTLVTNRQTDGETDRQTDRPAHIWSRICEFCANTS